MNAVTSEPSTFQPVLDLMGRLTPAQSRLALAIYQGIADQGLVSLDSLSSITDKPAEEIDAYLDEIPGVFRDETRNVVGFWGLTAAPVSQHLLINGAKILYAWCAWDTLFLPALLDKTFTVKSKCEQTGAGIELLVSPKEILSTSSQDLVVSMLVPNAADFERNILASFCHHIYFFESAQAGKEWLADKQNIELITLEQAFELGVLKNKLQFNI